MRWKNWTFGLFIDNPVVLVAAVAIVACFLVIAVIENQDTINAIGNDITNAINDVSSNIKDKISEKSESKAKQHEGEIWTVYTLIDDDGVKYVGRTKNFDARMRAHSYSAKTGDLVLGNKIGGLSYFEARGLEQTLMLEHHSLKSFGMGGRNSINGISPKNILKAHYMQAASDYIHNILSNEFYISIGI